MPHTIDELLNFASQFEKNAKEKSDKKLDPKAKVRNRGTVCIPASSAKDKKDHFPINDEGQARNALARVHQYDKVPSWYNGSLKGLQDAVSRKVHSKYPSIGKEKKKTSSVAEVYTNLIRKYASASEIANIIKGYEDGASTVRAFVEAMKMVAHSYAQEGNLDDPKTRRIYELYLKEASVVEEVIGEIENIDAEIERIEGGGYPFAQQEEGSPEDEIEFNQ